MLKLNVIEIFLRLLPESLLFMFGGYAFSKCFVDKKRLIISGILLAIATYTVRELPIDFGVHTVIILLIFAFLNIVVNKFEVNKAISSVIISFIIEFLIEEINVLFIQYVLKLNINSVFGDPVLKSVFGIPSLLMFGGVVGAYYFIMYKREALRYVSGGKNIK